MDRTQLILNTLAQQRNDALDAFVNAQADLVVVRAELEAVKEALEAAKASLALIPANEVIQYPPGAPVVELPKEEGEHGPEVLP